MINTTRDRLANNLIFERGHIAAFTLHNKSEGELIVLLCGTHANEVSLLQVLGFTDGSNRRQTTHARTRTYTHIHTANLSSRGHAPSSLIDLAYFSSKIRFSPAAMFQYSLPSCSKKESTAVAVTEGESVRK